MTEKVVPDYAHVVVVPIANPTTAPELIKLAEAFVRRDGGRVIALAVTLSDGDAEGNRELLDKLETIVQNFQPQRNPLAASVVAANNDTPAPEIASPNPLPNNTPPITIDFVTRTANNIARGILDQTRESGAELVLLGVHKSGRGEVAIGPIAQSVMSAASCDVLVYRHSASPEFNRIFVPVDGSAAARMAVRVGILFGNAYSGTPVEAVHVQGRSKFDYDEEGETVIRQSVDGLPGRGIVKQTLIHADSVSEAILSRVDKDHLIIMGFNHRQDFKEWLKGEKESKTRAILDHAPGPVLLAMRSTQAVTRNQRRMRRLIGWARPALTDVEQEQIVWTAKGNATLTLDYVVLMIVSAMLASLGLLINSSAVIIGAMLVAPLMAPLNAFAIGLSTAHFNIMRRAFFTTVAGFLIASAVSLGIGVLVPLQAPTTEMMSRVSPTLLDAFIALASGVAGSYATARRDIPAALAGVAIAAALVPPICTFGLQIAFGEVALGLGAALLFVTNIVSIAVIATAVFLWLGLHPRALDRNSFRAYIPTVVLVLLSLGMVYFVLNSFQAAQSESRVEAAVEEVFTGLDIASVDSDNDEVTVTLTLLTPFEMSKEAVAAAEALIQERTGEDLTLRVLVQEMVTSDEVSTLELPPESLFRLMDGRLIPIPVPPAEVEPPAEEVEPTTTQGDD